VGFSEAEIGEFVASGRGRKADPKLIADIYQTSDGNPLFVDGIARWMVVEGGLDRAGSDGSTSLMQCRSRFGGGSRSCRTKAAEGYRSLR